MVLLFYVFSISCDNTFNTAAILWQSIYTCIYYRVWGNKRKQQNKYYKTIYHFIAARVHMLCTNSETITSSLFRQYSETDEHLHCILSAQLLSKLCVILIKKTYFRNVFLLHASYMITGGHNSGEMSWFVKAWQHWQYEVPK